MVTATNRRSSRTRGGFANNATAREHVAATSRPTSRALLSSDAEIEVRAKDGTTPAASAMRPAHVAVLVRTHRNAALIRDALDEVDMPAVINGAGSVFGTAPARDWLRLLEALERPVVARARPRGRAHPLPGLDAERVASADDDDREELHRRLHRWARRAARRAWPR